jgi:hypothetical protein
LAVNHYDQVFCSSICCQDKLIDACGCCDIGIPTIRNASYCTSKQQIKCLFEFISSFPFLQNNTCKNVCRKECFKIDYEIEKSILRFPSQNYLNFLHIHEFSSSKFPKEHTKLEKYAKKSFLKLMVNYKTVEYTVIEENAQMTFETLLGSIGGQLGLFIGISVLSLMEVIELFFEFFLVFIKLYRR